MTAGVAVGARLGFERATEVAWARYLGLGELARRGLVFVAAIGALLVRRPDSLLRPQFILEDGAFYTATWFANGPLELLFRPYAGYQSLAIRVAAALERVVPVALAPLVDNLLGLALVAALAAFLASDRMATVIPDARWRLALAGLVVVLPGVHETFGTMVDVQRLAALFLIAFFFARPARGRAGTLADLTAVAVAGLSGLTGVLLQPLFWWRAYRLRRRADFLVVAVLGIVTLVQAASLIVDGRRSAELMQPLTIAGIFIRRLFLDWPLGMQVGVLLGLAAVPLVLGVLASIPMLAGTLRAWWKLPAGVRGPLLYAWLAMVGGAFMAQRDGVNLAFPQAAPRYFLVPGALMLLAIGAWFIRGRPGRERTGAFVLVAVFTLGIGADFRLPSLPDDHWTATSQCIGGVDPCVVPVYFSPTWDIRWPGVEGEYEFPRPGG
ncbi:MAG: hypothetical protein QOH61_317 [Chloroflexota bacterium]|jgi:hypothetical protein|nr:hypothetical protein [Chloroflexota bacterium]